MRYRCEFILKVGERDHQYFCDPQTPTEEAEYVLNHFLGMIREIKEKNTPKNECETSENESNNEPEKSE